MANYIQIRRSNTSVSPANTLVSGELAYSYAANVLYVGAQTGISGTGFRIGGAQYIYLDRAAVGNLTANAAVIVDGNSFISNTYTSGLVISPSTSSPTLVINSVSDYNYSNTVLGALQGNNELVTANAIAHYVQTQVLSGGVYANGAPASGSNGALQYNDQSSGFNTIAGADNLHYDKTTGTLTVGNTSSHVHMGYITDLQATQENQGNQNNYIQAMIQNSNNGIEASADWVAYNDDTSYSTFIDMGITSSTYANASSTITPAGTGYIYTGNAALAIGTNATSSNVVIFTGGLMAANERMRFDSTGNVAIATTDTSLATFTVNGTATFTAGIYANGGLGSNGYTLHSNGSALYWDNPTAGAAGANTEITFNENGYANGNPNFTFDVTSNTLTVNGTINVASISANGSLGTAGQALHSDGANLYWANSSAVAGSDTWVQYNFGGTTTGADANLAFDYTTGTLTVSNTVRTAIFNLSGSNTTFTDAGNSVVIGTGMDLENTNSDRVAIGSSAGYSSQNTAAIAIGLNAGNYRQHVDAIAIGEGAGYSNQHINGIGIGYEAASNSQLWDAIAIGAQAGYESQSYYSIAIGKGAGSNTQQAYSVAVGRFAGSNSQQSSAVAIGQYAGYDTQGEYSIAIGDRAGYTNQSTNAIAIGVEAGYSGQADSSVAIGNYAGNDSQNTNAVAVGSQAGEQSQQEQAVAIGYQAGNYDQGERGVAVGTYAGANNQGSETVAIGYEAGQANQTSDAVAIGSRSASVSQGDSAVAIGYKAGQIYQGNSAISVGQNAGQYNQQDSAIAIGRYAGDQGQSAGAIAIGLYSSTGTDDVYYTPTFNNGDTTWLIDVSGDGGELDYFVAQYLADTDRKVYVTGPGVQPGTFITSGSAGTYTVNLAAVDNSSGTVLITYGGQGENAVAIGSGAGDNFQGANTVAIGYYAASANQKFGAVAIGLNSGAADQGYQAIAIGESAGAANQAYQSISLGYYAGSNGQHERAVAMGYYAGANGQGIKAVAIGRSAGQDSQGQDSIAIGHRAGQTTQAVGAIALGRYAGQTNQGNNSIAIGYMAGVTNQGNNSIILNANGTTLDTTTSGFFVDPIRNLVASSNNSSNFLFYDTTSRELSYSSLVDALASNTLSIGNTTVNTFINSSSMNVNSITVANIYSNATINAASFTINGNLTANSLGIYLGTGTYVNAAAVNATSLGVNGDAIITGNLTVQGTLTTIDTTQVAIADINLKLASNNASDVVDFGFYGQYNVANTTYYSGLFRDHTMGDATHAVYHLYSTSTEPGMTAPYVVDGTDPSYHLSTLMSYLDTGKGFVANATNISITGNSTVNVAISANTLHLDSALPANSGGTGLNTYLAGDIIFASGSYSGGGESSTTLTTLSVPIAAANDQILMIKNNLPAYSDTIDGGTF
jgi:hypothetical protein